MIGGACGLPERGKRATGASRFYRVTATPGPLFVKWRDSLSVPRTCDPWAGSAAPDNSSRSPRDARKPVHFFHCAGKGTRLAAQKLEDVSEFRVNSTRPPILADTTSHLGRTWPTNPGGKGDKP